MPLWNYVQERAHDEACIFVEDCFRMYTMFFKEKGWSYDILNSTEGGMKGIKEISIEITGEGIYGALKFESGVHRVRRVPETESQRACTYIGNYRCGFARGRRS